MDRRQARLGHAPFARDDKPELIRVGALLDRDVVMMMASFVNFVTLEPLRGGDFDSQAAGAWMWAGA